MNTITTTLAAARRAGVFALTLALGTFMLAGTASAQNATNGQAVYGRTIVSGVRSCLSCHGTPQEDPVISRGANAANIKAAVASQPRMQPLNGAISDAEFNDLAAYIGRTMSITPTYIAVTNAPSIALSATSLSFASQNVGSTSTAQTLTVSNATNATAALAFTSIGTTAGSDFSVSGGTCSTTNTVAAGGSCTVNLSFRPTAAGTRNGTLTLAHNGAGGRSDVSLSGTGVSTTPVASASPSTLTFSSVVGTASLPLRVTLSNTGTGNLVLSSLALGGSHASDFGLAGSSTCSANTSLAGGSSCAIDVVFTPGATGSRSSTLTVAHNATGTPTTITLVGTGTATAQPGIALDATSIDLGNQVVDVTSSARTITLTNSGTAALTLSSVALTGTDGGNFVLGGSCSAGASVAARGTCTITVAMRPITLGTKVATLNIASNAPTGTATVAVRGVSVNTPAPEVGLSQAALDFGSVTFGVRSIARTVTLSNTGTAAMTISSIASTSSEFAVTHNCPSSLAVAASCVISVTFTPTNANVAESVVITTNALSSPNSIVLTGLGSTATMPALTWQPAASSLAFASTVVGVTSASQSLTLVNQGPGTALINSLGVAGADASSFAIASGSTCRAGLSLAPNATCSVVVSFVPGSTGAKTANLQIASNATPPGDVVLSGSGASPSTGSGTITVSPTTLDFSSIGIVTGQTSSSLTVTVSNGSAAVATVSRIAVSGQFAIVSSTNACATSGVTLSPGGSCTVAVVFSPTAAGSATGTLSFATTSNQTVDVALRGQANAATPRLAWQGNTTSLAFSSTVAGMTSATQTLMLTNPGSVAATLSGVSLSGADAASFAVASSSTCRAGLSLAAGNSCSVVLSFSPASAGAKTATLRVDSNATSPGDVVLSGTGTAANAGQGMLTLNTSSLDFGGTSVDIGQTSAAMSVTVSNGNVAAVTLSRAEVSGAFRLTANTCPVSSSAIAVNSTCTVSVAFAPTASGVSTGRLTLTTATGQTLVVALRGVSTAPAPVLAWQTGGVTALQFDNTQVGRTSVGRSVTLLNQGPGSVTFSAVEPDGNDKSQFVVLSGTTCSNGATLAQGASCQIVLAFAPTGAGSKSATLRIASNATAPATMSLAGVASAPSSGSGSLWMDFSELGFMAANGRPSGMQTVTVRNTGSDVLTLSSIGTSGPFQVVNSASGGCSVPQQLAAGASCALSVVFNAPHTAGDSTGELMVQTSGGDTLAVKLGGRSVVTNAGSSSDGTEGGGALSWLGLVVLAWAVAMLALQRRREGSEC
jgi:cytochrome c553